MDETTSAEGFHTTHWSILHARNDHADGDIHSALEYLSSHYWKPLYVFLRKSGHPPHKAQDHIQGFFYQIIQNPEFLQKADKNKGKFRSFLIGALRYYLSDLRKAEMAQKRGGRLEHVTFDFEDSESLYQHFYKDQDTDETQSEYDRCWAFSIFQKAVSQLAALHCDGIHKAVFEWITGTSSHSSIQQLAKAHGATEEALRMRISRMRSELRAAIDQEIKQTVRSQDDFNSEKIYLLNLIQTYG